MQKFFDENAPKKATNLSVNSDLLLKVRGLKINSSPTLETDLVRQAGKPVRAEWLNGNKDAIYNLNEFTEKNGLFSESSKE